MKNSPLAAFLLAVLALSAVLSVVSCAFWISNTHQLRLMRGKINFVQNKSVAVSSLANETIEYSKTHPAIDPILEWANLKPKPTAGATSKPGTK